MSGSPPPDPPPEPPQIAGRRRKRSETPPTTTAPAAVSPPTPLEHSAQSTFAQARGGQLGGDVLGQAVPYSSSYPPPPAAYGSGVHMGALATTPPDPLFAAGQVSPKSVRKTKAHVASACVNCKKKHLRCDNARPCRRCVQSGKEDSCRDVEHKKRGRPPLRPDEPSSRRSFDPTSSMISGQPSDPSRRLPVTDSAILAQPPYSRTFRPLQAQPPFDPSQPQIGPGLPYSIYAPPTIQPSPAIAVGSIVPSSRQYTTEQPSLGAQPRSAYTMSPPDAPRPMGPYPGSYTYPAPQEQMGMPPTQLYSNPIFPRSQLPPPQPEALPGMMGPGSLQLPPIRSPAERSPIDPALAPTGHGHEVSPREQGSGPGTTRQPDPKRPRMDIQGILGPKND